MRQSQMLCCQLSDRADIADGCRPAQCTLQPVERDARLAALPAIQPEQVNAVQLDLIDLIASDMSFSCEAGAGGAFKNATFNVSPSANARSSNGT